MRKFLLGVVVAALFWTASPAQADLITNGGFETGNLTGWTVSYSTTDGGYYEVTGSHTGDPRDVPYPTGPHSGSYFFNAFSTAATLTASFSTTVGQSYDLSLWSNTSHNWPGNTAGYQIDGGSVVNIAPTSSWAETTDTFVATGTTTSLTLHYTTQPYRGTWRFDDISVSMSAVPEPASLALFGLGAAVLALRRRRRRVA